MLVEEGKELKVSRNSGCHLWTAPNVKVLRVLCIRPITSSNATENIICVCEHSRINCNISEILIDKAPLLLM